MPATCYGGWRSSGRPRAWGSSWPRSATRSAKLPDDRAPTKEEWETFAGQWRPRLDHQIAVLEAIRDKLSACIGCGCQTLDACDVFNPGDMAAEQGPGAHYLLGEH